MSDELIEGRDTRNRPPEPPAPEPPPAPQGRKSRLKGKPQPKAEDEKSGPYVTLEPPDEAGNPIRAQADEPTFHKGMKPVVADPGASTPADPDELDSSAPAPDLPWDVIEQTPAAAPEPEPAPEPAPVAPLARPPKADSIMKLPRIRTEQPDPETPPDRPIPTRAEDFVPLFHTPTGELPPVPDDVTPEPPPKRSAPPVSEEVDFIPQFHTPTGELPAVPDDYEAEEDTVDEPLPPVSQEIPRIRRAEDSLTPGILRPVPDDIEEEHTPPEIPPIRRASRRPGRDEEEPVALDDDTGGGLPKLRRMVDEVTGEVIDADWVQEVGEGQPLRREPARARGQGVEAKIAERLEARRAEANRKPAVRLSQRTVLSVISIIALIALVLFVANRLGVFGGPKGGPGAPTAPAAIPTSSSGAQPTTLAGGTSPPVGGLDYRSGRLAFATNRDGNYEIYVMDMASGATTRLTNNTAADRSPAWSPDGTQIAYVSNMRGNDDLYVIPAGGGTPIQLTIDPGSDRNPAWSPDGSTIVSTRENVDGSRLIAIPAGCITQPSTCESQVKLLTPGGYDRFPSWASSGSKVAFTASDLPGGASVIAVLNPDGSGYQSFPGTRTSDLSPAWSPDATKIAFLSYAEGDYDLWIMYADGTGVTQITKSRATDGAPGWSPNGRYIVFASDRDDKQHFNLYLIQTDCIIAGSNCEDSLIRLTNQPADDLDPAWTQN